MKLAIIFNRYHTSMLCKRAPVHLQCYTTSTGTSNSTSSMHAMLRAPVHRILHLQCYATSTGTSNSRQAKSTSTSTQKRSNLEYQYLLGTNSYFDQSQYFRTIYPNLQFCYFKFRQKTFGSVFLPSCLSVEHNLNLNFSLNQRDNILLVTFLNQSSTH